MVIKKSLVRVTALFVSFVLCFCINAAMYAARVWDESIEEAQIGDIFYNPRDVYSGDWILAKKIQGTTTAEFVVIYKNL